MSLISNSWILVLLWMIVYSDPAFSCGGLVTGRKGEITTPNFPSSYGNNLDCTWTIQVDDNETITILFLTFNVEKSRILGVACADTFSVYDGPDKASTQLITPCGYGIPGPLHSSGNALTLTFDSDWSYGYSGVHLKWKVSDKFTLHTEAKTWEEANAVCVKDGGHLAVMTDLNKQLILNVLSDLWIGEYYTPRIWLKDGVSTPSACKTIEKTYDGLITSFQPNCQLSLAFICQKDAVLCGGKFYKNSGTISSPGYPGEYENNDYCEWEIYVSEERVIEIVFHDVDIEQTVSKTCTFDYIEVLENHIKPPQSIRKICGESSNVSIISASNQVLITFKTDKLVSKRGFYLEWMSDLIPTTTSTNDTTTTSTTDTTTTSTTDTTTTSTTDTTTTSTTDKQSSSSTKENEKKETDKLINETQDTDKAGLGGATLAGIVVGAVLALLVVVVIVVVVFVTKRKKERKAGAQTILELKALESTKPANTPSNSETPQQDVYSNPVPKAYRQPQQPVSDDHVQLDSGDDTYYHHLRQTNINKAPPGESRNPYGRLHTPDLYDHTTDSKVQETGDMYDHFDSDKTDSLDKDGKGTDAYSRGTPQKMQNPNVYDYTTAPVGQNRQDTYNVANANKTDWLHSKDEDSINTSNNGSNEIVTKGTHDRENYLTPIGENTMGHANTDDIETKHTSKNDYEQEIDNEEDTYYNVSDDKTNEQTADSEEHLYEIEDAEQDYDNLNN